MPCSAWLSVFGRIARVAGFGLFCLSGLAQSLAPPLRGFLSAHDPSTLIRCNNRYYVFSTGPGVASKSSADKIFWSAGAPVFTNAPSWTTNAVPGFAGIFWAPDVLFFNHKYYLYYAVSTFGSQVSAIGLATNPTLDPADPAYQWSDQGPVIQSSNGGAYNTIDPSFCWDASGNLWMAFGSYWSGIYATQLDPVSGQRITPVSPTYQLAYNSSIEASYLYRRGGYYYLFVNWGSCCSGVNSTYNIRVGRATTVTGPYLDRNGVNMTSGGGTLFQRGTGKFAGPGHVGILSEGGMEWISYHYYDANDWAPQYNAYGEAKLALMPLSWTADDWPLLTNDWSAVYNFEADACDNNRQYYGLVQNGARIQNDPVHGHVLNLNGTNQFVWLPPGAGYGQTFAAVVNWRGGGAWQRIFDFGFDTSRTVMLTPASGDNVLRCDLNPGGNLQVLQWNKPLPTNVWTHVAVTLDGTRGILYVNGAAVSTNASMNLLPVNVAPQTNHLGRSKFSADPFFNGQFAAFRVYGRALSPAEITAPLPEIVQPNAGATWSPGATIVFSGRATDFADVPLAATNLSWLVSYCQDGLTNVVLGPLSGQASGTFTIPTNSPGNGDYIFALTATDLSNRQSSVSTGIRPANPPTEWASFYPFDAGAQDASNRFNGLLLGGASIQSDPARGPVLNLSGANQYVSLPAGASAAQSISGWMKWRGGNAWQRFFDFGRDTQDFFFLTPKDSSGLMQCAITSDLSAYNQVIQSAAPFPLNQWTHVAVVMDGREGILYLNGTAVAVNDSLNLLPSDIAATKSLLGRSQYPTDPYLNGQLDNLLLSSSALSATEITKSFLQPTLTVGITGTQATLAWPDWAGNMQLYSATNLSPPTVWTLVTNQPTSAGGSLKVTVPAVPGNRFFRLQWP